MNEWMNEWMNESFIQSFIYPFPESHKCTGIEPYCFSLFRIKRLCIALLILFHRWSGITCVFGMFQFVLSMFGDTLPAHLRSGGDDIVRPLSSGSQHYKTDSTRWPAHQPMAKITANLQVGLEQPVFSQISWQVSKSGENLERILPLWIFQTQEHFINLFICLRTAWGMFSYEANHGHQVMNTR